MQSGRGWRTPGQQRLAVEVQWWYLHLLRWAPQLGVTPPTTHVPTTNEMIQPRVQTSFARQGLMTTLGAKMLEATNGRCRVGIDFGEGLTQQHGLWHGAVSAALADVAAGFAAYTMMDEDRQPLSIEFKVNWVAPARGSRLEARAEVVANGFRVKHVQVEVVSQEAGAETVVAIALATIAATRSVKEVE